MPHARTLSHEPRNRRVYTRYYYTWSGRMRFFGDKCLCCKRKGEILIHFTWRSISYAHIRNPHTRSHAAATEHTTRAQEPYVIAIYAHAVRGGNCRSAKHARPSPHWRTHSSTTHSLGEHKFSWDFVSALKEARHTRCSCRSSRPWRATGPIHVVLSRIRMLIYVLCHTHAYAHPCVTVNKANACNSFGRVIVCGLCAYW